MSYCHLTYFDRCEIQLLKRAGHSLREIAREMGRSPSTICRELKRHSDHRGRYKALRAQVQAVQHQRGKARIPRLRHKPLQDYVIGKLEDDWSPEQISARLPLEYPESPEMRVSHETLYQFIYADKRAGGTLYTHLRQAHRQRRRRANKKGLRGQIPNRRPIEKRPKAVAQKKRIGDWEGDTVFGKGHRNPIATFTERKTQYLVGAIMPDKQAASLINAAKRAFAPLPDMPVHTITVDNGKEFAAFEELEKQLNTTVYFARPYRATDRALNEQVNGLIRQYLPKGTDFKGLTQETLNRIVDKLNNRPRKRLGFRTPAEVFFGYDVALSA
jgi:IS30 family transposase